MCNLSHLVQELKTLMLLLTLDNGIWRQKELELSVLCSVWSGWEEPGTSGGRAGGRKQETLDKSHLPWIMEQMEIIRVLSLYSSEVLFWVKKNAGKFDWFFCSISGWHDLWQIIVVMVRNHILGYKQRLHLFFQWLKQNITVDNRHGHNLGTILYADVDRGVEKRIKFGLISYNFTVSKFSALNKLNRDTTCRAKIGGWRLYIVQIFLTSDTNFGHSYYCEPLPNIFRACNVLIAISIIFWNS